MTVTKAIKVADLNQFELLYAGLRVIGIFSVGRQSCLNCLAFLLRKGRL